MERYATRGARQIAKPACDELGLLDDVARPSVTNSASNLARTLPPVRSPERRSQSGRWPRLTAARRAPPCNVIYHSTDAPECPAAITMIPKGRLGPRSAIEVIHGSDRCYRPAESRLPEEVIADVVRIDELADRDLIGHRVG